MTDVKSAQLLIYPSRPGPGWIIKHRQSGAIVYLPEACYTYWEKWNPDQLERVQPGVFKLLIDNGMILPGALQPALPDNPLDAVIPEISDQFAKSYAESCDTVILFNSECMPQNNPLLVLSPYGSLCWNLILNKKPIGQIRRTAQEIFGADEVLPFLNKLQRLGFLARFGPSEIREGSKPEKIAKAFLAPEVQFELPRTRIPWYSLWELCTICDLRCQLCYLPNFSNAGASSDDLLRWAKQAVDAGIFYAGLLGGEVLLRDDLEKLVSFFRDSGVFVKIITNGQKLDLERARTLAEAGLNQIEISFDGLTTRTHDASRGPGAFQSAYRALFAAAESGIPRRAIVWTIHSGNIKEVDRLGRFMTEIGVTECYISNYRKTGLLGSGAPWHPLTESQIQAVRASLARIRQEYADLTITMMSECSCGRSSMIVSPDGGVRVCTFSTDVFGNLGEESLAAIWSRLDEICVGDGPFGFCRNQQNNVL